MLGILDSDCEDNDSLMLDPGFGAPFCDGVCVALSVSGLLRLVYYRKTLIFDHWLSKNASYL